MTKHPSDRLEALAAAVALHRQQIQVNHGDRTRADDDADLLATASAIFGWLTRPTEHDPVIVGLTERIASLEEHMAQVDDIILVINDRTNALAERVRRVIEDTDAETAEKLRPIATALDGIAVDKNDPAPPLEPEPEPV